MTLTDEQMYEATHTAAPALLELAKQWADNKIHVYQFTDEAARIVRKSVERAVLAAAPQAVPAGWVLVPVEPTEAMLDAASRASMQHLLDCIHDPKRAKEVGSEAMVRKTHAARYRTMLAAAPSPKESNDE